jgi:hypothetical protein
LEKRRKRSRAKLARDEGEQGRAGGCRLAVEEQEVERDGKAAAEKREGEGAARARREATVRRNREGRLAK